MRQAVERMTNPPLKVYSHKNSSEVQEPCEATVDRPSHITLTIVLIFVNRNLFLNSPISHSPVS